MEVAWAYSLDIRDLSIDSYALGNADTEEAPCRTHDGPYCPVMANPLFSTYRGGENRVTSSTMAVFERVDLALVQEILETASGTGGELRTVVFENQVFEEGAIPDARISARFTWWFETKTV